MFLRGSIFSVVCLFSVTTNLVADDSNWPFVRGPQFDGHSSETGIIDHWSEDGPPVLWSRNLGQGYSAVVAADDRVYTQAQNMTGQYLYCLEADTGNTIWEYRYDWPYEAAGVYPGPRSTPTLANERVYFSSPDGYLGCLDADDGAEIWSVDMQDVYGISGCDFGYACSPTVTDNMVIMPVGGKGAGVVAFDARTGAEVWKSTDEPASYTPAFPIELADTPLVVCYMKNAVLILDRGDGTLRYRKELSQGYDEHSAWPVYSEPYLWLSGPFRSGSFVLDLSSLIDESGDVATLWRSKTMSNDVCSSVFADGHIFGFDIFDVQSKTHRPSRGIFRCISMETGEETWSVGTGRPRRTSNTDEFSEDIGQSGIIVVDGKLIVLNELGELILLKADPQQRHELARCTILGGELTWTPPCLHKGRLYVRNQSRVVCVYIGNSADVAAAAKLRATDLPQRQYHNLAAMVLAVEPEYAFDIPHNRWLIQWFFTCTALILMGKVLLMFLQKKEWSNRQIYAREFIIMVLLGAAGTTLLGHLTKEFVFTWPVCLYAALEYVVRNPETGASEGQKRSFIARRLPLIAFLLTTVFYFLACRRLSLVFEWAFLVGFVSGVPFVWIFNRVKKLSPSRPVLQLVSSVIGFISFYAGAVWFLKSRY